MRERSIIAYVRFAVSGPCQYGTGLSSSPLYFSYFSCLVGPEAHCGNAVQAQRPDIPIIRERVRVVKGAECPLLGALVDAVPYRVDGSSL
ncbi:hypothetical protein Tco_0133556 [Tanacetum coccineum]